MQNTCFNHHQRIRHIVASYGLTGDDPAPFDDYLTNLMQAFPEPLIELAIVETLVQQWLRVPLLRGIEFLETAHQVLQGWDSVVESRLTPSYFEMITGLDPAPIFKALEALIQDCSSAAEGMARAIVPTPTTEMP
ncbi:MAG: hypothetical protein ICV62_00555 [Cyanobacteria bacterium Co-bin13]|nr:hypothetical protein [Cyanobacteria bacterium Co-bin13]